MKLKELYLIFSIFAISFTGIAYGVQLPDHVAFPENLPEEAKRTNGFGTTTIISGNLRADFVPSLVTTQDPSLHIINDTDGTALMIFNNKSWGCSGTLIADDLILTASHCVSNSEGVVDAETGTVYFGNVEHQGNWDFTSDYEYQMVEFINHPESNGDYLRGFDIAIVRIATDADANIPRIPIDTDNSDTVGQEISIHGFGLGGYGENGYSLPFGTHRAGDNSIDDFADTMMNALKIKGNKYIKGSVIQSDFDNGLESNDAFDFFFNIPHTGVGDEESKVCSGDSGGAIRNAEGEITGVNSYSVRLESRFGGSPDVDGDLNCSHGEFTGYMNVPFHSEWILSVVNGEPIPEPEPDAPVCPNPNSNHPACR